MKLNEVYDWQLHDEERKAKRAELRASRAERKPNTPPEFKQLLMALTAILPWPFKKPTTRWGPWGHTVFYQATGGPRRYVNVSYDSRNPSKFEERFEIRANVDNKLQAAIEATVKGLPFAGQISKRFHHTF